MSHQKQEPQCRVNLSRLASACLFAAALVSSPLHAHPSSVIHAERLADATPEELRDCKKPTWPLHALRTEQKGDVTVAFLVDVDGKVIDAIIRKSSKHPMLDESAKAGILRC